MFESSFSNESQPYRSDSIAEVVSAVYEACRTAVFPDESVRAAEQGWCKVVCAAYLLVAVSHRCSLLHRTLFARTIAEAATRCLLCTPNVLSLQAVTYSIAALGLTTMGLGVL